MADVSRAIDDECGNKDGDEDEVGIHVEKSRDQTYTGLNDMINRHRP